MATMKLLICGLLVSSMIAVVLSTNAKVPNILTQSVLKGVKRLGENCMKSVGATLEEMNSIRHGPPYKGKAACAVGCIFDKAGIMSNKKFSKKGFTSALTPLLLNDMKRLAHMKNIANDCEKESADSENECAAAEHIVQCLHKHIPQIKEIEF